MSSENSCHSLSLYEEDREKRVQRVGTDIWMRRYTDSRHKPDDTFNILVRSTEEHLTRRGIHPDMYSQVYAKATDIYVRKYKDIGPFNVDCILEAVEELKTAELTPKAEKRVYSCNSCKDTGYKMQGLLPVLERLGCRMEKVRCDHGLGDS
jgi:hypothetical protein